MRKKYCCEESVFGFVWEHADRDGMWTGDSATVAAAFGVTDNEAYAVLGDLCDRDRLQRLESAKYIIVRWRESDDPGEDEVTC